MRSHAHERDTTQCSVDVVFGDDDHRVFNAFILILEPKNNRLWDVREGLRTAQTRWSTIRMPNATLRRAPYWPEISDNAIKRCR